MKSGVSLLTDAHSLRGQRPRPRRHRLIRRDGRREGFESGALARRDVGVRESEGAPDHAIVGVMDHDSDLRDPRQGLGQRVPNLTAYAQPNELLFGGAGPGTGPGRPTTA